MRDRTPFFLGLEGEYWETKLPALCIPIPASDRHVLVMRTQDGSYKVLALNGDVVCSDLLMTASVVVDRIASYHAR